jgi:cytosine/adenosine deaminase-related metal-dependent hydrolase
MHRPMLVTLAPGSLSENNEQCSKAIGLDEAGINDDRDMLQEMRMVLRAHRVPGMDEEDVPSVAQVLRMATAGGAMTTPFGSHIGSLAVGKAADLVLIDWDKISFPYLDQETPIVEGVIQRARSDCVDLVVVAGEVIYERGAVHPGRPRRRAARAASIIAVPKRTCRITALAHDDSDRTIIEMACM